MFQNTKLTFPETIKLLLTLFNLFSILIKQYLYLITITLFFCLFLFIWFKYIEKKIIGLYPSNFPNKINRGNADETKPTLVCFGDSITHGNVSYNWVKYLRQKLPYLNIYNAGMNADLSHTLLLRMDDIILCRPDFITILIGTNDVNATLSEKNLQRYISRGKIMPKEEANLKSYLDNYENIISRLKSTTSAQIALVTLPLISEDLLFEGNYITQLYNNEIKTLSEKHQIELLDFRQKQLELLPKKSYNNFWSYKKSRIMMNCSIFIRYTFHVSWNFNSKMFSNYTSPDNIHLNETSGNLLLSLVLEWVSKKQAKSSLELG
jgi:lysophospholipase L1-like esterase